jgi:hypothetical protein
LDLDTNKDIERFAEEWIYQGCVKKPYPYPLTGTPRLRNHIIDATSGLDVWEKSI